MRTTKCEVKNTLDGKNGKLDLAKEKISELKHIEIETIQSETQREIRIFKNEKSISELWEYFKQPNICTSLVPEGISRRQRKYLKNF